MPYLSPNRSQPEGMCCWPRHWPETPLTSPVASMATTVPTGAAGGCACRGLPPNQLAFRSTGARPLARAGAWPRGPARGGPRRAARSAGSRCCIPCPRACGRSCGCPGRRPRAPRPGPSFTRRAAQRRICRGDCARVVVGAWRGSASFGAAARGGTAWFEAALPQDPRGKTENAVTCGRVRCPGKPTRIPRHP